MIYHQVKSLCHHHSNNKSENEGLCGIPNDPSTLLPIGIDALVRGIFINGSICDAVGVNTKLDIGGVIVGEGVE